MRCHKLFRSYQKHFHHFPVIILIGYLLLVSNLISCSHPDRNRRRMPEVKEPKPADQIIPDMKSWLKLTDEQVVNIRPTIEEQVKKRNELVKKYKDQGREGRDSLRDELKDLRISTEKQLQYFLTNEQIIDYGYMQQEEDQRITGITSEKPHEGASQEKPKSGGRRRGGF